MGQLNQLGISKNNNKEIMTIEVPTLPIFIKGFKGLVVYWST